MAISFFKCADEHSLPCLPYEEAFQTVADKARAILVIRKPNEHSLTLIEENYATKSKHVPAKTSDAGITAGFVVEKASFGKGDKGMQNLRIKQSFKAGCGRVPLNISTRRIRYLERKNLIHVKTLFQQEDRFFYHVKASYGNESYWFELRQNKAVDGFWEVWYDNQPLMALTNPGKDETGIKAAVVSDYDLFAIFFRKNLSTPERAVNIPPRLRSGSGTLVTKLFQQYIDSIAKSNKTIAMDEEQGNISLPEKKIIGMLNKAIKEAGYKGKALVWHGTETANPNALRPDFPLLAYIPEKKPLIIENEEQLSDFYKFLEDSEYRCEKNQRFSLPTYRARANTI